METEGLEYVVDTCGVLWKGPVDTAGNLHWCRFEGRDVAGGLIWTAARSDKPNGRPVLDIGLELHTQLQRFDFGYTHHPYGVEEMAYQVSQDNFEPPDYSLGFLIMMMGLVSAAIVFSGIAWVLLGG